MVDEPLWMNFDQSSCPVFQINNFIITNINLNWQSSPQQVYRPASRPSVLFKLSGYVLMKETDRRPTSLLFSARLSSFCALTNNLIGEEEEEEEDHRGSRARSAGTCLLHSLCSAHIAARCQRQKLTMRRIFQRGKRETRERKRGGKMSKDERERAYQ